MINLDLITELGGKIIGEINPEKITDIHNVYQEITPNSIYIAIKGAQHDGASFINQAIERGAIAIVTSKMIDDLPVAQIVVEDTISFVIRYATKARQLFKNKVIGIVGSVGKTTLRHTLSFCLPGKKLYTRKSFNIKFSIALSMMLLDNSYDYAIIEIGTNFPGEVDNIARMIQPDYTLISTIGIEHTEFLGNLDNILKEEYSILPYTKDIAISAFQNLNYLKEYDLMNLIENVKKHYFLPRFSKEGSNIQIEIEDRIYNFKNPTKDIGLVSSLVFTIFLSDLLKLNMEEVLKNIEDIHNVCYRYSTLKIGKLTIFDCSYNANPTSVNNTLDSIDQKCSFILGEMKELGIITKEEHFRILSKIFENQLIENCYTYGNIEIPEEFKTKIKPYNNDILDKITGILYVQGSRSLRMELIIFKILNNKFSQFAKNKEFLI